ncbi:hypothetical protein BS78_10G120100 [Paspalum vaginatum]|nr:hypothetical protein BS78_10G120100 [Paspalum vaginatum]
MDETQASNHRDGVEAPEDTTFPRATVTRIMHRVLPRNTKIPVDAKEAMDKCVTEFAAMVMSAAMHECRRDRRLTVTGDDLILGMSNLGFDDCVGPLTEYLRRYRESVGIVKRGRQTDLMPRQQLSAAAAGDEEAPPPSPGLTLQLAPPSVHDVTELGFDTDVYAVWQAVRAPAPAAAAGTSRMPPPPPAADE